MTSPDAKPVGGGAVQSLPQIDGESIWLVVYEDEDLQPVRFTGSGASSAAYRFFENARQQWTCRLYRCVAQSGYGP